jgi:hypothetical protein
MKHNDLLNKPIPNYNQLKTIFESRHVRNETLSTPHKHVDDMNYLAENKAHGSSKADMTRPARRISLRTCVFASSIASATVGGR